MSKAVYASGYVSLLGCNFPGTTPNESKCSVGRHIQNEVALSVFVYATIEIFETKLF